MFCTLDVLVCSAFLGVCVLTAFLAELLYFISCICRNMLCVTVTLIHICVSVGGGWLECVYFALLIF